MNESSSYLRKLMERGFYPQSWNYLDRFKISSNNLFDGRQTFYNLREETSPTRPARETDGEASRTSGLIRSGFKVFSVSLGIEICLLVY